MGAVVRTPPSSPARRAESPNAVVTRPHWRLCCADSRVTWSRCLNCVYTVTEAAGRAARELPWQTLPLCVSGSITPQRDDGHTSPHICARSGMECASQLYLHTKL